MMKAFTIEIRGNRKKNLISAYIVTDEPEPQRRLLGSLSMYVADTVPGSYESFCKWVEKVAALLLKKIAEDKGIKVTSITIVNPEDN